MKTADHITTSQNLQHQKARPPFAGKDGEQLFFSEVHPDIQPFFNPQPQAKDNFFFTPPPIQAKLAIGRPGDKYEQEADAVADKVVENLAAAAVADRTPQAPPPVSGNGQAASVNACPAVQPEKEEAPEDKEQEGNDKEIRRKPIFESEDNSGQDDIQPKRSNEPPAIQPKEEEEMASEEDQERGTGEPDVSVAGPDEGVEVANGENTAETAAETASAAGPEVSGNTAKDETARNQEPVAETAQPGQEVAPAGGETAGLAEEAAAGTSGATEKAAEKEMPAEKEAGSESKPSESKMEASLSGGTASGAGEKGSSGTTSGSEEKAAGESGGSKTSGEGQTTQIAESAAGGGAMASEKKAGEEKGEEGGGQEIPMEKEGYEFPEPDEKLPGQMPPPLPLGISKGQQKNLILSKGATVEEASAELSGKLQQSKGKGKPLEEAASQQMGQQMGADFSDVKIHTDNEAASMNQELGAKAFTHGKDIYFNQGQYDTGSDEGKRLLAHELTHTVQQGAVSSVSPKLEKPDAPTPTQASPSIQRFGGLVGGLIGAAGSAARGLAVEGIKRALKALGEKAMEKIMAEVMGLKGDKDQKEGDWKSQLMTMGMEFLTGEKKKEAAIGEANAGAEEQMAVKKGKEDAEKGKADPLPAWIMALIEKVLAFASSSGGGEKGGLMGTDQKAEQEAVQSGVQEDTAGWEQINAVANELAPIAGEKEKDVKNMVSALGKLKENGWKSLPAWLELFQAGKGLIPELGGMAETGKQALTDGLNKLKGKLGENATQLWEVGSKLANGILNGSGTFRERALQAAKDFGLHMLGDARQVGEKVLGEAQGLEGRGGKLANVLMSLIDGRAAKVFNTVSSAISEGGTLLQAVPGRIGQAARSAFEWVKNRLAQGKGRLQQIIARVKAFVVKVKNAIAQMLKRAWEFLKNAVKKAIEAGKRLLKKAWEKIKELARKAMAKARELLKKVTDKIKAFLKPALDWLKKKIIKPIKNMIKKAKDWIKKKIEALKEKWRKRFGKKKEDSEDKDKSHRVKELARNKLKARLGQEVSLERARVVVREVYNELKPSGLKSLLLKDSLGNEEKFFIDASASSLDHIIALIPKIYMKKHDVQLAVRVTLIDEPTQEELGFESSEGEFRPIEKTGERGDFGEAPIVGRIFRPRAGSRQVELATWNAKSTHKHKEGSRTHAEHKFKSWLDGRGEDFKSRIEKIELQLNKISPCDDDCRLLKETSKEIRSKFNPNAQFQISWKEVYYAGSTPYEHTSEAGIGHLIAGGWEFSGSPLPEGLTEEAVEKGKQLVQEIK